MSLAVASTQVVNNANHCVFR